MDAYCTVNVLGACSVTDGVLFSLRRHNFKPVVSHLCSTPMYEMFTDLY
jgi:hypothetical protein